MKGYMKYCGRGRSSATPISDMTNGGSPSWEMKPGTVLGADRFLLIEPLGQGGMGVVWLAHDQRLDEDVALKLVPPEIRTDAGALEDLRRETLRSRKLSHPNIIRLHDLNEFAGEPPFISMEFVDGQTVAAWKAQQPQRLFTWEQVRPIMKQLCDALEYAHGEKVVHRDLKPANMMLDRRGRLKLADFGLAAVVSELTSRVSIRANTSGTPAYMSPQQMDGRTPRVTDDIYALGATLYELLTSKPPFYHGDIPHQVRNLPPDPVEQRLAELELSNPVPPFVGALIMACLAKDPAQRPQSAAAVAEWLQLGNQSVASALASEITQRSVPTPGSSAFSSSPTPIPVAVPLPASSRASGSEPAPAPVVEELPASPKASGKSKLLVAIVGLVVLGIIGAIVMQLGGGGEGEVSAGGPAAPDVPAGAQALFNGRDLSGWSKLGPDVWRVEGGVIKATSRLAARSYLVADQRATDFELTFEYRPSSQKTGDGHHGVFYRSTMPSPGAIASGLAMPLEPGPNNGVLLVGNNGNFAHQPGYAPEPLRTDDWNQIRIRVEGTRILQVINGTTTYEAERPELFNARLGDQIAFEIWNSGAGGERSVEIRNLILRQLGSPAGPAPETQIASGQGGAWDDLYTYVQGSTEKLRGFKQPRFPSASWEVRDGFLRSVPGSTPVDLLTRDKYEDFEFEMEYTIGAESNSGIIYRATEAATASHQTGPEMQLVGASARGVDAPEHKHGALFGLLGTTRNPGVPPTGGYALAKVRVQNGRVEHMINLQVVLEYNWNDTALQQAGRNRFKHPGFMWSQEGHIAIQHRGGEIMIRRMRIRRL
jgi:serine/threonine protein kinase